MRKLYIACWMIFATVVYSTPTTESFAYFPHGSVSSTDPNACGVSTNSWCVNTSGWTVFSGSPCSATSTCTGTACTNNSSSTYNGTCISSFDNVAVATFNGTVAGNVLTVNSVTSGAVVAGQTLFVNGLQTSITISSGSGVSFTLSGSGLDGAGPIAMTTVAGNDSTCKMEPQPPTLTSTNLSGWTPSFPCATALKAQQNARNSSDDWILARSGGTYGGGMNTNISNFTGSISGTTLTVTNKTGSFVSGGALIGANIPVGVIVSGSGPYTISQNLGTIAAEPMTNLYNSGNLVNKIGLSSARPLLIASYGTGARPIFDTTGYSTPCVSSTATYLAVINLDCYDSAWDPSSVNFHSIQTTGDLHGTTTIDNIPSTAGIFTGDYVYANGVGVVTVTAVAANSVTISSAAALSGTGVAIQFSPPKATNGINSSVAGLMIVENTMMRFGGMGIGVTISGTSNLRYRRNVIADAWGGGGTGLQFFLGDNQSSSSTILIEEQVVDHQGWNAAWWGGCGNIFTHNYYLHDWNPQIQFIRNITSNASATGAQVRNAGYIYNNTFINNPIALGSPEDGVNLNPALSSYNVFDNADDITVGIRTIHNTVAAASVNPLIQVDGAVTGSGTCSFGDPASDYLLENLSNPGSMSGMNTNGVASTTSLNTTGTVSAGVRGNGIQAGDQILVYAGRGWGAVVGPTALFPPTGTTIGSGTTSFTMPTALPAWVTPGMTVVAYNLGSVWTSGVSTTVASASGTNLVTTDATNTSLSGNEQAYFAIYTTGVTNNQPSNVFGPNNVFTGNVSAGGDCAFAISPQQTTQGINATGNYFYTWCTNTTRNFQDLGLTGQNTITPNTTVAIGTKPTASIEAYDASIQANSFTGTIASNILTTTGGNPAVGDVLFGTGVTESTYVVSGSAGTYLVAARNGRSVANVGPVTMTSGSVTHFLSNARLNQNGSWDTRYTANAANNFIRNAIGCTVASTPPCPPQ